MRRRRQAGRTNEESGNASQICTHNKLAQTRKLPARVGAKRCEPKPNGAAERLGVDDYDDDVTNLYEVTVS